MRRNTHPNIDEVFRRERTYDDKFGVCLHCGIASVFENLVDYSHGAVRVVPEDSPGLAEIKVGFCHACHCLVFGVIHDGGSTHLWPAKTWPDNAPAGVPPEIKSKYDDARMVLPLSPSAAAVLARRCLQHVIREKLGIKERTLNLEIIEAEKREELTKTTSVVLHQVRTIGNWGAHPTKDEADTLIDVTPEVAAFTLSALEMVFRDLYEGPAFAAEMQSLLDAKKVGASRPA